MRSPLSFTREWPEEAPAEPWDESPEEPSGARFVTLLALESLEPTKPFGLYSAPQYAPGEELGLDTWATAAE